MTKKNNARFPEELLSQSKDVRIAYFAEKIVAHKFATQAFASIKEFLSYTKPPPIIIIYGPSGVGKTTLLNKTEEWANKKYDSTALKKQNLIPFARIEAVTPERGSFDWKDFYYHALAELDEPFLNNKVDLENPKIIKKNGKYSLKYNENSTRAFGRSFEESLKNRQTKIFAIDEAQNYLKVPRGNKKSDHMNAIKSLSNLTGTTILLFGTLPLVGLTNLDGQLTRREYEIAFHRYRINLADKKDNKKNTAHFIDALATFQNHLPLKYEVDLCQDWEYFYSRTLGCVGILKDWLCRCLDYTLNQDEEKPLTFEVAEKNAIPLGKINSMYKTFTENERKVEEAQRADEKTVLMKLGLDVAEDFEETKKKRAGKSFQRKPARYTVNS